MTTTYCNRLNIESIIGIPAVLACINDKQDGVESPTDTTRITDAIERAADEMNECLTQQYVLSQLSGSSWCRWCNAYVASWFLFERRGNPVPPGIVDAVQTYREKLEQIRWGRFQVPEVLPSFSARPTVSNFNPELGKFQNPIRVITEESTGDTPDATDPSRVKRNKAYQEGWW
jgi:hypothetical protein